MPIIRAEILEGRTPAMKEHFIEALTAAAVEALGVKPEQVRVILNEMPRANYGMGGKSVARREKEAAEEK